jgi:chromosome segregation protein
MNKINQRKKDMNASIEEINNKVKEMNDEKQKLQSHIDSREKEREEINNKISQFKQKHNLDNIGEVEKKVEEIDKKSETLQTDIHSLREQQHELIREKDTIKHEISVIDAQLKKVIDTEKEHEQHLDALKEKRSEFKKTTLELNKRLDEDSSLAAQLSNSRKKIHDSHEELAKLNVRQISIKEVTRADLATKKILELKNKRGGIYGTVADLGNVDSKYSIALEIAAGSRIKSVVVEDDKTAAELIRYLKENKLGTATFLPLNKIKPKHSNSSIKDLEKSNGCHGLAIDLVSFDKKFEKIFSYVFGDTLVVDNIDVARRLGIGKAKYATLDGDLAEFSGAMHGGFRLRKKQSFGFKEKDLAKNIEEQENAISELKNIVDVLEKRRIENEEQISSFREKKAHLEGDIIKTEKSLHLDVSDTSEGKKRKEELNEQDKQMEGKINDAINKISKTNRELTDLKVEKQKLRSEISQLRNPTLIAELNTFEQKIKEFSEEIITVNSEIKTISIQIDDIYNIEIEKTEKILKQTDKDLVDFDQELQNLKNEVKEKNNTLEEKERLAKDFYAKFKSLFGERSTIDGEIQKNDGIINNKVDESRKVEIRNNTFSLKITEINAALAGLQQEFSDYEGVKLDLEKNEEQLKYEIRKFEKMREGIGSVNMRALEIYEQVEKQYTSLLEKKDKLVREKEDVMAMMNEIEGKKKELFMESFEVVNENFKKFFTMLSSKGDAYLVLENPDDPFEAGLKINVKITGSKFMDIRSLSGGEKTMTALAFIFAIQEHEPASFYVLDEVDAALDKHNSEKFAKLIKSYAGNAQYLIISHNDAVISEGNNLYGVSMNEHGISQVVSLKI